MEPLKANANQFQSESPHFTMSLHLPVQLVVRCVVNLPQRNVILQTHLGASATPNPRCQPFVQVTKEKLKNRKEPPLTQSGHWSHPQRVACVTPPPLSGALACCGGGRFAQAWRVTSGPPWDPKNIWGCISQTLHECHICLHWGGLRGQCRHIWHAWSVWV